MQKLFFAFLATSIAGVALIAGMPDQPDRWAAVLYEDGSLYEDGQDRANVIDYGLTFDDCQKIQEVRPHISCEREGW